MLKAIAAALAIVIASAAGPAFAYETAPVKDAGSIAGFVRYDGPAPKPVELAIKRDRAICAARPHLSQALVVGADGGIRDAVVSIANIAAGAPLQPNPDVKFDQKECEFVPHVIAFAAGSTVEVMNSDPLMHDLRTYSKANPPLNFAQPPTVKSIKVVVEKPELIKVGCYMHPWMRGWWYVAANPYYAVSDAVGKFTIADVPPGTYTISVWQEKLGEQKQSVTVKPGHQATVNFVFKPKQ